MDLILSAICEAALTRDDGKLDLQGVFSQLQAPGFPASQAAMTAVFVIEWERTEHGRRSLRADLVDEAGKTVLTIQGHTDVAQSAETAARAQTRLIMPLENVVFPHAGSYHFRLTVEGEVRRACSLHVAQAGDGTPSQAGG